MTAILAIDPGRHSAWCHGAPGGAPTSGHIDSVPRRSRKVPETSLEAYARLRAEVRALVLILPLEGLARVYIEAPYGASKGSDRSRAHGGAHAAQVVARCAQVWVDVLLQQGVAARTICDEVRAVTWQAHYRLGRGVRRSREALEPVIVAEAVALGGTWGPMVAGRRSQDEACARGLWLWGCGAWKAEQMKGRVLELVGGEIAWTKRQRK